MDNEKKYAFISYSTKNQQDADILRDILIKNHIGCWRAPDDIPTGSRYAHVINDAIEQCACVVLLLTEESQKSVWVEKELECAESYRKPILPIRIGKFSLNSGFRFLLGNLQIVSITQIDETSDIWIKIQDSIEQFVPVIQKENNAPTRKIGIDNRLKLAEEWNKRGDDYYRGRGVEKNEEKAFEWYNRAARAGNIFGMVNVAYAYQHGEGVEQDYKRAFYWYKKSAEAQDARGMNYLADAYYKGMGVKQSYIEAFQWYEKSAEAGSARGMSNLACAYSCGHGVEKDLSKAVYWFEQAAELGDIDSMKHLSECYLYGIGTEKNKAKAEYWQKKANGTLS